MLRKLRTNAWTRMTLTSSRWFLNVFKLLYIDTYVQSTIHFTNIYLVLVL